eukprot:TRINITY_DN10627_c0_g1_i2.p1 TRINITY_DN10627_c0_g1~~TRINITY_DN10627_c0_g1_i2.p1  ORF type:complete len:286 (+),score=58.29 TRINITY_DN10627_c0_g1_i2:114-971(+)
MSLPAGLPGLVPVKQSKCPPPGVPGLAQDPASPMSAQAAALTKSFSSRCSAAFIQSGSLLEPLVACEKCTEGAGTKDLHTRAVSEGQFASRILPWLYLGGAHDAQRVEMVREATITHVINLCTEIEIPEARGVVYLRFQVKDSSDERVRIREHFLRAFEFVEEARKKGGAVLVHCRQGISRSATLSMAYLMRLLRIPFRLARDIVKQKRPEVSPNIGFVTMLEEFEMELGVGCRRLADFHTVLADFGLSSRLTLPGCADSDSDDSPSDVETPRSPRPGPGFSAYV